MDNACFHPPRGTMPHRPHLPSYVAMRVAASVIVALSNGCAEGRRPGAPSEAVTAPVATLAPPPPPSPASVTPVIRSCQESSSFRVGAARADITGPFVQISTGYTEPGITMEGLAMHLYARAFVIESPCSGQRVAYVNADLLHTYQSLQTGVIRRLRERLPGVYDDRNVMIVGTHDHAAPTNVSFRTLYNLANGVIGFDELHYDILVEGITDAIVRAHGARVDARVHVARGHVPGAAHNRSLPAYESNGDAHEYDAPVEDGMTLLRFSAMDGRPIGAISWFAAHATSLGPDVHLVHGDNKGYAAYTMERRVASAVGTDFVAGFSNGAMGDVSPNQPDPAHPAGPFLRPSDLDPSLDLYDDARVHGMRQLEEAMRLFDGASEEVHGGVFYRHRFAEFQDVPVDPAYGAPAGARTCVAAIGAGFVPGTEEGGTSLIASLEEGDLTYQGIPVVPEIRPEAYACHAEKQVILPVGDVSGFWVDDEPWVDTIVPFQIFAIGNIAIVGSSFEQTTMVGRRIRKVLSGTLGPMGVTDVVIAGIANSYHHYMTTREEYARQHFEGAFTQFGPWSAAAWLERADGLARALVTGQDVPRGPIPPDLLEDQVVHTWIDSVGVVRDAAPSGKAFGDVVTQPAPRYSAGTGTAEARFWTAHPRTVQSLRFGSASLASFRFLEVQRRMGGEWTTVADDADPSTRMLWARDGGSLSPRSIATVHWDLDDAEPGTYRIVHRGVAKTLFLGLFPRYQAFEGVSAEFVVE